MQNLSFCDTHCHPSLPTEENFSFNDYYAQATQKNVTSLILSAAHLRASEAYANYALLEKNVFFSAGTHPHDAEKEAENPFSAFEQFKNHPKLCAIGEIGLDYFYDFSERKPQQKVFEQFLQLALDWNLPAIIHCRDKTPDGPAYADCFAMLNDFAKDNGKFVLHCFAGSLDYAEKCFELGGYAGITGIVTFNQSENIREFVAMAPESQILLETDSPYLAPKPYRGKVNHPQYIPIIAQKVAEVRGITLESCAQITTQNAFKFFNLPTELNPYTAP